MASQILHKLLNEIVKENKYENPSVAVNLVYYEGISYTSYVPYTVTITEVGKEDLHMFARVAIKKDAKQTAMFDLEHSMHMELHKTYEDIQNACDIPPEKKLVMPKLYGYNPKELEETIVVEDLQPKGFIPFNRLKCIDWKYAAKSVESLAKIHALSMAYRDNNPVEFNEFVKKANAQEDIYSGVADTAYKQRVEATLAVISDQNKNKLKVYLNKVSAVSLYDIQKSYQRPVLCHGDYRPSNILHKVHKNGSLEVVPTSFHSIQSGSPLSDLLYFIFTGSDEQFRRRHFQALMDHYYKELSNILRSLKLNPDYIYSKTNFEHDLKQYLPYGLIMAILFLPIVSEQDEKAPTVQRGHRGIEPVTQTKTGPWFKERINGIINDYLRWGLI
ncbi:uncharacterized protein LOC131842446 [Achroia grisella]|uniref:uncharacterized protein LOC131842446 n=1 Tax=Achroia grisella TaxID=688607 RepID=UPI0027D341A2|nr:uncharacterized protein LOC131842446 [Achroia grisella]